MRMPRGAMGHAAMQRNPTTDPSVSAGPKKFSSICLRLTERRNARFSRAEDVLTFSGLIYLTRPKFVSRNVQNK